MNSIEKRLYWAKKKAESTARLLKEIREYKIKTGCVDCGYNQHHAGLEFDHLEPRDGKMTIAQMAGKGYIKKVWSEIEKCEVVCGTCHKIRTWNRRIKPA